MGFPVLPCYLLSVSKTHGEEGKSCVYRGTYSPDQFSRNCKTDVEQVVAYKYIINFSSKRVSARYDIYLADITFGKRLKFRRLYSAYRHDCPQAFVALLTGYASKLTLANAKPKFPPERESVDTRPLLDSYATCEFRMRSVLALCPSNPASLFSAYV